MSFYTYNQNNSGGGFTVDYADGIGHFVIIEADSADDANEMAREIGLYFDGVSNDIDCECCGDRWYEARNTGDGVPTLYGEPVEESSVVTDRTYWNTVFVHYADGNVKWFGGEEE
ncbi:DUF7296 family protein [Streptomyces sp. NPDC002644]